MRKNNRYTLCLLAIGCFCLWVPLSLSAQVNVTTHHNNNARTGLNSQEAILAPGVVNQIQFGKLFSDVLNGYVFAQPLYVSNLAIPGMGTHNTVFVATEADTVYALDADHKLDPLWTANLLDGPHGGRPGEIPMSPLDIQYPYSNAFNAIIGPQVGITSTPVIDLSTNRIYVATKSKAPDPNNPGQYLFAHRLHALDITTGNEVAHSPVTISGTVNGGGGPITFNALEHLNRTSLLLSNGTVYVGFASQVDWTPFQGWVFAYESASLASKGFFLSEYSQPDGEGGVWMSGEGPAADSSGNVFVATGNGVFDSSINSLGYPSGYDFGTSLVKLALAGGSLSPIDYFTPYNQASLGYTWNDQDLGAGGIILLPDQAGSHPHLLVIAGKDGTIYLLNRDQLTAGNLHYCSGCYTDPQIVQELPGAFSSYPQANYYGSPVYWNGNVYFWAINDYLKAYSITNGLLSATPSRTSGDQYGSSSDPMGGHMSISSNGNQNAIVWSLSSEYYALSAYPVLRAHDATNLNLLYSSDLTGGRDNPGGPVKFQVPTVANGKVFVGGANQLTVYGLFGPTLTVSTSGPGKVTSSPTGISCGSYCSAMFTTGAVITLTAVPNAGSTFAGWSGAGCSGTGTCTVSLNTSTSVTATFH
jgi:hypothetical protein